jgi:hypothetical protein
MKCADATVSDVPRAVADLVVDVADGEHGLGATTEVRLVETTFDPALAMVQLSVYRRVHSKTLVAGIMEKPSTLHTLQERRGFSSFSPNGSIRTEKSTLVQGLE